MTLWSQKVPARRWSAASSLSGLVAMRCCGHWRFARTARNGGLGGNLLEHAEDHARASGVSELWLLTTTAADFFRLAGYAEVDRSRASAELQSSTQFAELCPATAVCMKRTL